MDIGEQVSDDGGEDYCHFTCKSMEQLYFLNALLSIMCIVQAHLVVFIFCVTFSCRFSIFHMHPICLKYTYVQAEGLTFCFVCNVAFW